MTEKEKYLGEFLNRIADEINITPTMQDKAIKSYEAVGKWLGDGMEYDVKIMPQGSMNLGTVIRPIDDSDDYDVDLVCLLKDGGDLSLSQIKNLVGNRLKENITYRRLLEDEGKRCWTMQYEEFHMDILPCVPRDTYFIIPLLTAIKLTHKITDNLYIPKYSDPYAYHEWFEGRMKEALDIEKRAYATKNKVEIDNVPTYKMRTPLQKAIQLLKRHRDICFQDNDDNAPISIIITTLAAQAYNGESDIYEALCKILMNMDKYIECRDGIYWVANPVMKEENFAEKWQSDPIKHTAFVEWLKKAKQELITAPLSCYGLNTVADKYKQFLGKAPVERAAKNMGLDTRNARQNGTLYTNGLSGGITTAATQISKPVKEHTFFGK